MNKSNHKGMIAKYQHKNVSRSFIWFICCPTRSQHLPRNQYRKLRFFSFFIFYIYYNKFFKICQIKIYFSLQSDCLLLTSYRSRDPPVLSILFLNIRNYLIVEKTLSQDLQLFSEFCLIFIFYKYYNKIFKFCQTRKFLLRATLFIYNTILCIRA